MMTSTAERSREQNLRRAARRQGLVLQKSRVRDPRALDYGKWLVLDARGMTVAREMASIDAVEAYLNGEGR